MDICFTRGHQLSLVERYFEPASIDPFYNEEVLATLYGSHWNSVLITESGNAFFHTFSKHRIEGQELRARDEAGFGTRQEQRRTRHLGGLRNPPER